jgi:hypothetical protein
MRVWVAVAALALSVAGCGGFTRWMRGHTYPADFRYVTRAEIRSAMWELANHAAALDRALRAGGAPDEAMRAEILRALDGLEEATRALGREGQRSNPLIDANLDAFRRGDAERTPPNYFFAGAVTGACMPAGTWRAADSDGSEAPSRVPCVAESQGELARTNRTEEEPECVSWC